MNIFSFFQNLGKSKIVEEPVSEPIEMCPVGDHELIRINKKDGVYCGECGEKHSEYTSWAKEVRRRYITGEFLFVCPRCMSDDYKADYKKGKHGTAETLKTCHNCDAKFHAPTGFCVSCWDELANNGRCINVLCGRYQKPNIPKSTRKKK